MKNAFIVIFLCLLGFQIYASTLHAIVIAATNDDIPKVAKGAQESFDDVKREIKYIEKYTDLYVKTYYCSGSSFNRSKVANIINNLDVGSDDVILFHYIGHGWRSTNQPSNWPNLSIGYEEDEYGDILDEEDKAVDFDIIQRALRGKGARLIIALADACNNRQNSGYYEWDGIRGNASLSASTGRSSRVYKQLFENASGYVVAGAASSGQKAYISAEDGGYFTSSFVEVLKETTTFSQSASWEDIVKRTKRRTTQLAKGENKTQTPMSSISVRGDGNSYVSNSSGSVSNNFNVSNQSQAPFEAYGYQNNSAPVARAVFYDGTYFYMMSNGIIVNDYKQVLGRSVYTAYPQNFKYAICYLTPDGYGGYRPLYYQVDIYDNIWVLSQDVYGQLLSSIIGKITY